MFTNCERLGMASTKICYNYYALVLKRKLVPIKTFHWMKPVASFAIKCLT